MVGRALREVCDDENRLCLAALGALSRFGRVRTGRRARRGPVDNPQAPGPASKQAAMVCYRHTGLINDG
jgi:hypothetical protein